MSGKLKLRLIVLLLFFGLYIISKGVKKTQYFMYSKKEKKIRRSLWYTSF